MTPKSRSLDLRPVLFPWYPPPPDDLFLTPEDVARLQLRIKAVVARGSAIIEPVCNHHDGIDWTNNCFDSYVCKGRVVWIR